MIDPNEFYGTPNSPSEDSKSRMWETIESRIIPPVHKRLFALERRSFLYGIAAAIILGFTSIGIYVTVKNSIDYAQPPVVRIDRAYQSAIHEFEKVSLDLDVTDSTLPSHAEVRASRQEQLRELETAIAELRVDTRPSDLSPLKQTKLRELYAKKLSLLQTMLEQGDLEL